MSRPALNRCSKCGTTENLTKQSNICKPCKAARDRTYNEKRLKQQAEARRLKKLAGVAFLRPMIGPCGRDFDSEVCPKRQILAVNRARAKKKVDNICCLDCTIKIQEAQQ